MSLPSFFDPARVAELYLERAAMVAEEAAKAGSRPVLPGAPRVAVFGIDCQVGFCLPGASLYVPGAEADMARATAWILRNLERITTLVFSLDTHAAHQIFHPSWWVDEAGQHPAPFTPITRADVEAGRWRPVREAGASLAYVRALEEGGRYVLTIWPYHCLLGGLSHALVPALAEAALYHALVRGQPTRFELKGQAPATESYSVFGPEVTETGGERLGAFNEALFQTLLSHDEVWVFGEASSHCVLSTLRDLLARIQQVDPSLARRVRVLVDAMSPVPAPPLVPLPPGLDFPRLAAEGLAELAAAGMVLARTTDPAGDPDGGQEYSLLS